MAENRKQDAEQSKPQEPGEAGGAQPVDQETQKEASEEREKEGGYD